MGTGSVTNMVGKEMGDMDVFDLMVCVLADKCVSESMVYVKEL